jgi:outer membrane lipoprotein-sorting protein
LADFVTKVNDAFDQMRIPEAPPPGETLKSLRQVLEQNQDANRHDLAATNQKPRLLTFRRRLALAGLSFSTIAALALLFLTLNSGGQLSGMERMAARLNEVTSYRFRVYSETTTTDDQARQQTTWRETGADFWRAPNAFRGAERIVQLKSADGVLAAEKVLEDFVEIFPANKRGIFIDHHRKTFFFEDYEPLGSTTYPMVPLKKIREDGPPPTRDLGSKQISGKKAQGYEVNLTVGNPPRKHDWQVWIDPQTDLPLEIGYQVDDHGQPRTTTVFRLLDFHWNEQLDSSLFEVSTPAGYREIPPPKIPPGEPEGDEQRPTSND